MNSSSTPSLLPCGPMPTADGSASVQTSFAGLGARGEAQLLASAGFGPSPAGQLFEGLLPLQPISPEAQAVVANILVPAQGLPQGEAVTQPQTGELPLFADEGESADLPAEPAVDPEMAPSEDELLLPVGGLPAQSQPDKTPDGDELAGESLVAATLVPVIAPETATPQTPASPVDATEGEAGEGAPLLAATTTPRGQRATVGSSVTNDEVQPQTATAEAAAAGAAGKKEAGRTPFADQLVARTPHAETRAQPTTPIQPQTAATTASTAPSPAAATATPTPASPDAVETQVQRTGVVEATAGLQTPSTKRASDSRVPSTTATSAVAQRALAGNPAVSTPAPAVEPEAATKSTADVAGLVDDTPAVALPQQVAGWKKILLNAYKQSVKTIEETVGIKDAKTDGIMPTVLSSPFIPTESVAPVAPGSAVLSSVPAEWAEKLADLTARAERLAPARLEVSLPMEGADDLRVRVSCRGGQINCEFHNVSQELQRLFLREWPGLSQLFGKESQLRVEQPTFVNLTNPQDRPGGDQSNRRQRDEQATREEDETIAAFFAAQRKPAGRAA